MKKSLLVIICACFFLLLNSSSNATPVEYKINFTQIEGSVTRSLEGSFFIDDSTIGVGFENLSFGPFSPEMSLITDFTVTLNNISVYSFDLARTQAVGLPPFSSVFKTDSNGEVIDIQGAITLPGTISEIF
jgi:hypothetical protein